MTSILAELRSWATTLPYWEQAALDKIVAGVQFIDSEYGELLQYLLEDADLIKPTTKRPELKFPTSKDSDFRPYIGQVQLVEISNMQDVNALIPGQILTFGPALTVIYGATGSGKSGYARVLGCAGFTRGDKEVLPDATQPFCADKTPSADIRVSGETFGRVIHYQVGHECPEFALFYVFDSTSVHVHLTGSNKFSFSPAALSYLTKLANITDKVRKRLKDKIEEYKKPYDFSTFFYGESEVKELISNLAPDTDLEEIRSIAKLTEEEKKQIKKLDIEIANLKVKDISAQINEIQQTIEDLENLIEYLYETETKLSDSVISDIEEAIKKYLERQSATKYASVEQFKSEYFTQIGSDLWHKFIESAKELGEAEAPEKPYPQPEDRCLLCHQRLSPEAHNLLLRLWEFLEGEQKTKLDEAKKILEEKRKYLEEIDLNFFDEQSTYYRHLQEYDAKLPEPITNFIEICRKRRKIALENINNLAQKNTPSLSNSGISSIKEIIKKLNTEHDELKKEDPSQKIAGLEQKLLNLQHRELLNQYLPEIEKYVQKQIWAKRASKIGGSTRHITLKHNELFGKLVTEPYIQLFEKFLRVLQRPIRINIKTAGRKSEPYKQIVLEINQDAPMDIFEIDKVLSEGEKRIVALADFLTEVALDTDSNGIILDDPVTSLDLEWKDTIATLLTKEAKKRQVIVFTHDLPFLYSLKKYAEGKKIDIVTHWIKRGDEDDKPGYVFLNNSPALEKEYKKATKARELYEQAVKVPPKEQENLLHQGFSALRTSYEAFIIFDLLNEVVMRFGERISFGRLKDIVWDKAIVEEVIEKCDLLSRYIEGHLHPDTVEKPTCKTLIEEIKAFDALKKKLNSLKRSKKS